MPCLTLSQILIAFNQFSSFFPPPSLNSHMNKWMTFKETTNAE